MRTAERNKYIEMSLSASQFKGRIFYQIFANTREYEDLMVLVIGKALNLYTEVHNITKYKATIVIDGLRQAEAKRVAKSLRQLGVRIRKVRGEKDESNALLRLADAVAGLVREGSEGKENYTKIVKKLTKEKVVSELNP